MLVNDFMKLFFDQYVSVRLKPTTVSGYSVNIHNWIDPIIGYMDVDEITRHDLDDVVSCMQHNGISNTTIIYVLSVLRKGFNWGLRQGLHCNSIISLYDFPRKDKYKVSLLTADQLRILNSGSKSSDIYPGIMLASKYGLRRGEILGLTDSSFDFNSSCFQIRQTLVYINQVAVLTDCKTSYSRRFIRLSYDDCCSLERYNQRAKSSDGYFMRDLYGNSFTQNSFDNRFKKVLRDLRLPDVRIHDLRHSYATYMLKSGVNPKIVSEILGHSSVKVTLDIYTHIDLDSQQPCIDALQRLG